MNIYSLIGKERSELPDYNIHEAPHTSKMFLFSILTFFNP